MNEEEKEKKYVELDPKLVRAIKVAAYGRRKVEIPVGVWLFAGGLLAIAALRLLELGG